MAGVVRLSCGRIVQRYFSTFAGQTTTRNFRIKERICFHTSSILNSQEVKMPSLSPTMTEGTIVQWLKKEGDTVAPGDVLCEIQTDKAVMSFETEEEGVLAKILNKSLPKLRSTSYTSFPCFPSNVPRNTLSCYPLKYGHVSLPTNPMTRPNFTDHRFLVQQGTKDVKVGTLIALMVEEGEDWKTVGVPVSASGVGTTGGASGGASPPASGGSGSSSSSGGSVVGTGVKMPALSPTMTEGTIVAWKKKEGDSFQPGDALCEIQTDKAVMTFELDDEGVLAKILVKEGLVVKVGSLIAVTVEAGVDWTKVTIPAVSPTPVPAQVVASALADAAAAAPPPAPAFVGGSVPGQEIQMPALSPTMTEGQIVSWVKKEGDKLSPGDALCEIQTDKAVMTFEFEEEAVLAKILVPAGSGPVKVGQLIALTVNEDQDWKDVAIPVANAAPVAAAPPAAPASKPAAAAPVTPVHSGYHLEGDFAPAVRALLERYHLTGKEVTPSGRKKRLLKGDVLKYVADNKLQPKPPSAVPLPSQKAAPAAAGAVAATPVTRPPQKDYTDVEITTMRKVIAQRLSQSKSEIPHAYSTLQANIDSLMSARKQLANLGIKVSVNDFIVKAVSRALRQCPYMNSTFVKETVVPSPTVDISIAVATPNGLITPIIKNADQKSVDQISADMKQLAGKARQGKLQPNEFQGGSFTISNLGMFGISEFSAIINPPQCAILAVGGGRPYVTVDGKTATVMSATLSYDARAVSEDEVAAFMEVLTAYIENPGSLLLTGSINPRVSSNAEGLL